VSGVVTGATGAPLQNATVTLKQGDAVAAIATTDANGGYALRVRKGTYTLVVDYIDERTGKAVTQTAEIQAPSKNNTGNIRLQ
jgi:hypothetical protein